ncbi:MULTISPECIES: DUF779 domain-containing protein [Auritidibacter]|uniref:DUF779 domain-containing protein n=1 Tax=Auritidibacter TaxID=1160973 RepID=UPI000D730A31|nr:MULTISPECIES: DUF779 domain-containing protein [Auritidibacter]PXA81297.1 DUF779 domain-containing protein [Auritidibacter sp. NML120779]NIH71661.1 hypothetical protein [Auritidibacter ignavus]PXA77481.1 DUF779 domain-containing protein [Auritidibacter sp. NML100628]PXA81957.1 DUF779 domain-containing protein [Auritidibacter sp. NML120636]RMX24196.1 DUF779 domain-containing protein [Auritidibacter ignavus]
MSSHSDTAEKNADPEIFLVARPEISGEDFSRVSMTRSAFELLQKLWAFHGPLLFHQSGGCCDGSSPMCFPIGDFKTGASDVLLGTFEMSGPPGEGHRPDREGQTLPFWISAEQFQVWKHTRLCLDVVDGRGAGFSVEAPEGKRFLIRSNLLDQ